jgi:hypothetical protein
MYRYKSVMLVMFHIGGSKCKFVFRAKGGDKGGCHLKLNGEIFKFSY